MLHFQHSPAEHKEGTHANPDRALLQNQLRERLEFLLVLCEGRHVSYS
jgi:hypothetical protein